LPPEGRDPAYLWDMLTAALTIQECTSGLSHEQYLKQRVIQLAVERGLEILCEAARRVSDSLKAAHPEIPWQAIIAQRNVLAHQYGDIEHFRIWKVVTTHIPSLIAQLEPLIPPPPPAID
jgi:uncharacterized protein with HEPN domain